MLLKLPGLHNQVNLSKMAFCNVLEFKNRKTSLRCKRFLQMLKAIQLRKPAVRCPPQGLRLECHLCSSIHLWRTSLLGHCSASLHGSTVAPTYFLSADIYSDPWTWAVNRLASSQLSRVSATLQNACFLALCCHNISVLLWEEQVTTEAEVMLF